MDTKTERFNKYLRGAGDFDLEEQMTGGFLVPDDFVEQLIPRRRPAWLRRFWWTVRLTVGDVIVSIGQWIGGAD